MRIASNLLAELPVVVDLLAELLVALFLMLAQGFAARSCGIVHLRMPVHCR